MEVRRLADMGRLADLLRREPVNPVDDADDPAAFERELRDRSDVDRRVFELVDASRPGFPRTVVWVALTVGVPGSLVDLTDDRPAIAPHRADTAVFWSIWNVDSAAAGRSAGRDLIEGSVDLLRAELPGLTTFVTLSPVPGLRSWITDRAPSGSRSGERRPARLQELAAKYLTTLDAAGRPLDPVARFHLGNGARLWRVLVDADPTERGARRSYGVMANYRYEPEDRSANREQLRDGVVVVSPEVAELVEDTRSPAPRGSDPP